VDRIKRKVKKILEGRDPAHDFKHIMRVYKNNTELIGCRERADMEMLLPAALTLWSCTQRGSVKTSKSVDDSADMAEKWLRGYGYPKTG